MLIDLLEVVIWPGTILIILYWFRAQFKTVFSRVTDIQASATGVSMSFSEQLEATKKLARRISGDGTSKSSPLIDVSPDNARLKEVKSLEGGVKAHLLEIAQNANIEIGDKSIRSLNENLKEKGLLQFNKSKLISSFIDLTSSATAAVTEEQLNDVKEISKIITT